jgi:hypothetical protein
MTGYNAEMVHLQPCDCRIRANGGNESGLADVFGDQVGLHVRVGATTRGPLKQDYKTR